MISFASVHFVFVNIIDLFYVVFRLIEFCFVFTI